MTTIRSDSMYPLLFAGDRVRVSRLAGSEARPGDLVLFLDLQGGAPRLVAHRVLSRRGGVLRTKGDANLRLDPPLPESAVLGRVEAVATFGRLWELDLVRARRAGRLAAALAPALYAARRFIGTGALFALRRAALSAASRGSAPAAPGALDGDAPFFGFLSRDETWSGRVCLAGDVFVPPGVTLTLEAGTVLLSEPESLWSLLSPSGRGGPCALHLAGRLEARGRDGARVCLGGPAPWGGLRLRPGAEAVLAGCDAGGGTEAGVFVAGGARLTMDGCVFDGAGAGVRLGPGAEAALRGCVISGADGAGVLAEAGARLSLRDTRLERCATGLESRGALVALAGTCSTGHAHRGALVTGGRLEAESCRFDGNGGEGLLLAGGALAVVSRSGAADNRVGLAVNGADLTAVGFEARDNEDAGVDLAGGRARLTSVAVAGGLHGLRVSGGEAEVRALSLAECDRGVVVAGGSLRLDGAGVPGRGPAHAR
ncbi:MAG: right-handed parallel beta-helix repeat-containing protein, partial [Elusimicrobiota bacterium]|nr:right-handed parallel beta-helix repeat-containing protein [Elusimicrobiota bacterium]